MESVNLISNRKPGKWVPSDQSDCSVPVVNPCPTNQHALAKCQQLIDSFSLSGKINWNHILFADMLSVLYFEKLKEVCFVFSFV